MEMEGVGLPVLSKRDKKDNVGWDQFVIITNRMSRSNLARFTRPAKMTT